MTEPHQSPKPGKYTMNFKTIFDRAHADFIILNISVSDDLRQMIKSTAISETTEYSILGVDETMELKRYKAKKWIYCTLISKAKAALFDKILLDTGETQFRFASAIYLEDFIRGFKSELKILVQNVFKYSNIDVTVNIGVEK